MIKYIGIVLVAIGFALFFLYFFVGVPKVYEGETISSFHPHVYQELGQSIEQINVAAFYFVPKDRMESQAQDWLSLLTTTMQKLQEFHETQFGGMSRLSWRVEPEPIIGMEDGEAYDSDITQHGNPAALRKIAEELVPRVSHTEEGYEVSIVMYEGTGATGSAGIALLSRLFFTREEDKPFTTTFLAHEFYHALGVPDNYHTSLKVFPDGQEAAVEVLRSEDIMGRVRVPIEYAYLGRETLEALGL